MQCHMLMVRGTLQGEADSASGVHDHPGAALHRGPPAGCGAAAGHPP